MTAQQTNNGHENVTEYLEKKHIFIDLAFLEQFYQKFHAAHDSGLLSFVQFAESHKSWKELLGRSIVHIWSSSDREHFKNFYSKTSNEVGEIFKQLYWPIIKSIIDGGASIFDIIGLLNASINSLCIPEDEQVMRSMLLTEPDYSEQAQKTGLLNVRADDILNPDTLRLFRDTGPSVPRHININWETVLKSANARHNCNSMIIADNFCNNNPAENLYPILEALLPKNCIGAFHLSIFASFEQKNLNFDDEYIQIQESERKEMENEVCNWMKEHCSYPFLCEVFNSYVVYKVTYKTGQGYRYDKCFHDREIITNQIYLNCGSGFDAISRNQSQNKINMQAYYPTLVENIDHDSVKYWNLIGEANRCLIRSKKVSKNRLLKHHYGTITVDKEKNKILIVPVEMLPNWESKPISIKDDSWKKLREAKVKEDDIVVFELHVSSNPINPNSWYYQAKNVKVVYV